MFGGLKNTQEKTEKLLKGYRCNVKSGRNMYRYAMKGEDEIKGEVRKIGKAIAVTVNKDWLGEEVIVIRKAELIGKNKEGTFENRNHRCDIAEVEGVPDPVGERIRYADEAGLDPALLF